MFVAMVMLGVMAFFPIRRLVGGAGSAMSDQYDITKAWTGLAVGVLLSLCVLAAPVHAGHRSVEKRQQPLDQYSRAG